MGGLVSAEYATRLAPPNTVTDVITLGSPWAGTPLARVAIGENAREMEPHSTYLEKLKRDLIEHKEIRFCQVATKRDQIVIPGTSAALKNYEHFILEDVGHVSLLYSQRVSKKILAWCAKETPSERCSLN